MPMAARPGRKLLTFLLMASLESRPQGFHPQPLTERCVSISTHTAPIKQTRPPSQVSFGMANGFAALIRLLPLPVGRRMQPLDPAPLLRPHYRPSSLVRAGPPHKLALASLHLYIVRIRKRIRILSIGTLASWLSPLVLLPWHPSPGSRSSAQEPGPGSRPLYAGCRAPSNQVSGALIPEGFATPGFGSTSGLSTRHRRVCLRSSPRTVTARRLFSGL